MILWYKVKFTCLKLGLKMCMQNLDFMESHYIYFITGVRYAHQTAALATVIYRHRLGMPRSVYTGLVVRQAAILKFVSRKVNAAVGRIHSGEPAWPTANRRPPPPPQFSRLTTWPHIWKRNKSLLHCIGCIELERYIYNGLFSFSNAFPMESNNVFQKHFIYHI
jgi:hypothetical protein